MSRRSGIAIFILGAIAAVLVIFGIGDIQQGPKADPAITSAISGRLPDEVEAAEPTGYRLYDFATRMGGLNLIVIGLLLIAIVVVPYRAGRRWAWNAMWLLPAWALAVPAMYVAFGPAPGTPLPPPTISGPIVAGVAGLSLVVDRRRFTGNRAAARAADLEPA